MLGLGLGLSMVRSAGAIWVPSDEGTCTLFAVRGDYSASGGNGTWTSRVGSNLSHATAAPSAANGEPVFASASSNRLNGPNVSSILSTTEGTVAMVLKPTSHPADSGAVFNNKLFFSNTGFSSIGLSLASFAGQDRYQAHVYDNGVGYRAVQVAATYNVIRSVIMTFKNGEPVELMVDGMNNSGASGFEPSSTPVAAWGQTGGTLDIGGNHNSSVFADGPVSAIFTSSVKLGSDFAAKWNTYARANFGTP